MSKKESLKKDLLKGSLKKSIPSTKEIEKITEKVYNKPTAKEEPRQRTTIDIPKSLHIAAKMEAMKDGVSFKEFVLRLIKKELEERSK